MKNKDILFVIEIDTSLYDEAEHCTPAIKVLEKASSTFCTKKKVTLERELSTGSSDSRCHL